MSSNRRENKRALAERGATTNLVGIGQGQADAITMVGQQISMTVQDVLFPLLR
jgi:hypothetical protein